MPRAKDLDLLYISKSERVRLDTLKAGASLVERTGYTINQLKEKVIRDRLTLARTLLKEAQQASHAKPPAFRTTVSRAYYAMYHSVRAVCFFYHEGDDNEPHTKLPGAIPNDFPDRERWENDLKRARLERNRADYDPYPRKTSSFEVSANETLEHANLLLATARAYLRTKGFNV